MSVSSGSGAPNQPRPRSRRCARRPDLWGDQTGGISEIFWPTPKFSNGPATASWHRCARRDYHQQKRGGQSQESLLRVVWERCTAGGNHKNMLATAMHTARAPAPVGVKPAAKPQRAGHILQRPAPLRSLATKVRAGRPQLAWGGALASAPVPNARVRCGGRCIGPVGAVVGSN